MRLAITAPAAPPPTWAITYPGTVPHERSPIAASAIVTAGLKWAPDTGPKVMMIMYRTPAVAAAFSSNCRPMSSLNRSAMIPEPMTPMSRNAVPTNSAKSILFVMTHDASEHPTRHSQPAAVASRIVPNVRVVFTWISLIGFIAASCSAGGDGGSDRAAVSDPAAAAAGSDAATTATRVDQGDEEIDIFDATQIRGEPINQYDLVTGDCFNRLETLRAGRKVVITTKLGCDEAHQFEVFHKFDYDAPHPAIFPGDDVMTEFGMRTCYGEFDSYVGQMYELSEFEIGIFIPTRTNFEDSRSRYRGITCWLYSIESTETEGSARGVGT